MASSRPSFPAPSEPNLRRLGVGPPNNERPLRAQLVVIAVAVLVVLAVPLYLLRKPSTSSGEADAGGASGKRALIRADADAGPPLPKIRLDQPQRVTCSSAPNKPGNEGNLCDRLPQMEQELERAILKNVDCAPKTGKEGTINFVLTLNFTTKRVGVFPGASGQWRGPQAKAAAKCVLKSMPKIAWDSVPHRYRYYSIAIMATYPAPDPLLGLPEFE